MEEQPEKIMIKQELARIRKEENKTEISHAERSAWIGFIGGTILGLMVGALVGFITLTGIV